MKNLINKLLGAGSSTAIEGVSAEWVEKFERLLRQVEERSNQSGLARDLANYILRGESQAVLNVAAQNSTIAQALHLTGFGTTLDPYFYEKFDQLPIEIRLRWARLLETCVGNQVRTFTFQLPDDIHWPEILLMHSSGQSLSGYSHLRSKVKYLSAEGIESLLVEARLPASALLVSAFATPVNSRYAAEQRLQMVSDLDGYSEALNRHIEAIRPLILTDAIPQRLHVLNMLGTAANETLANLASELCALAVSTSKQTRVAANPLLRRCGESIFSPLQLIAVHDKPEQRLLALRLIWKCALELNNKEMQLFAQNTAQNDKAPLVQALISEWENEQANTDSAQPNYEYSVPTIEWSGTVTPSLSKLLENFWDQLNHSVRAANQQALEHHQRMLAKGHKFPLREAKLYSASELESLKEYIGSADPLCASKAGNYQSNWRHTQPLLPKLASEDDINPTVLLKILQFFSLIEDHSGRLTSLAVRAFNTMHRATGRPTLLELQQILKAVNFPEIGLFRTYCQKWTDSLAKDWSNEAVWPFFAHHLDLLTQHLTSNPVKDYWFDRSALFRAIATLPTPPQVLINTLFELALGPNKNDRIAAQEALSNHAGKESRIIDALSSGKAEVRTTAATWLAKLLYQPAVEALEKAVTKEKHDIAKGAMLDALQIFGCPIEKYMDRDALAVEAKKSISKGIPKDLEWFVWDALPKVRWADSKQSIDSEIIKWMLIQAVKQKSPEPNAVLRKYCLMFESRDRENLGQFVLETWLREDVNPISADEAMQRAINLAQSTHRYMQQYPKHFQNDPKLGWSVEQLTASYLPGFLAQPAGSAIGSKGLLAVASACAAERASTPVARYLKEYYGTRAAQGKALIAMLAWIDHPSAIQLMLSIGNRFRTKSFQEEATRQAEALAERKGWTLSELADRTIPSGGFDDTGTLELSYGFRKFTAKLLPDFKIELYNPDGKKINALPDPRQDDDIEIAKHTKKSYSSAKKEIKNIVTLQTERLYEALCTERDWLFDDWNMYLNQHPIMRRLLQRLVWVQIEDGKVTTSFRPLDDGTLTDVDDNEVVISSDARVRIAHDSLLTAQEVSQWQQHLIDYEVASLFQQFGKGIYKLPAEKENDDSIKEFEGYLLEAFALRGRALKLGYTRGAAEDGGWFHVYEKRFPTLGLEAVLEFTGNPLPEENRVVGLLQLYFANIDDKAWDRAKTPLGKVPKVLLSECYNDVRLIAAEGSGFDPDWKKKAEF